MDTDNPMLRLNDLGMPKDTLFATKMISERPIINNTIKQQEYVQTSRKINLKTTYLSDIELYFLNDKAELQSSSDEEDQTVKAPVLPFRLVDPDTRQRHINNRKRRNKKISFSQKLINCCTSEVICCNIRKKKQDNLPPVPFSRRIIIQPDGYGKLAWDLFCMVLIFYEILTIPLVMSFNLNISDDLEQFVNSCFYTDILINFNTAIYIQGNLCFDRSKITSEYLRLWFWLDVASSFPYSDIVTYALTQGDSNGSSSSDNQQLQTQQQLAQSTRLLRMLRFVRFIKVIRLLRLAKLKVIFDKIEEFLQLSTTIAAIMSFLQLSVFVLFWSHWLGCIFHFVAQNEDPNDNWLVYYQIDQTQWYVRYVISIYWAVTTMTTVGYGDISPRTTVERAFGIAFLLVACGVFSFTMNTIGAALQQLEGKKQEYSKQMSNINNYMKRVAIPAQLQTRVRRYFAYIWDSNHPVNLQHITQNLSQTLKYEFTIQVNGAMLARCQMLCNLFPDQILIDLTQCFKDATIFPDEFIFQEEEEKYTDKSLYFIQEGVVKIIQQRSKQTVCRLEKGDYFGEISFFTDQTRTASAQSVYFTDIFYLQRADFVEVIHRYKESLESFAAVKDSILFKADMTPLQASCYSCSRDDHVVRDCPSLHFVVDKYLFLRIKSKCTSAFMKQYLRRDRVLFHVWNDLPIIQKTARTRSLQQLVDSRYAEIEQCNSADQEANDEHEIKHQELQHIQFQSKFRAEKKQKRRLQTQLQEAESYKKIEILQHTNRRILYDLTLVVQGDREAQNRVNTYTRQMTSRSRANIKATMRKLTEQVPHFMIDEDETSEEERNRQKKKLNSYIDLYRLQRDFIEVKINQDNPDVEKSQLFISIADFDRGANFTNYLPHNNLSQVLREVDQCVLQEIHPQIQTQYSDEVFDEMVEFFALDLDDLKELQFRKSKKDQGFTDLVYYGASRQMRKSMKNGSVGLIANLRYSKRFEQMQQSESEKSPSLININEVPQYHYEPEVEEQILNIANQ